jgi:hypothetical protein
MALTTTTLNGSVTASAQFITLTAYTAPSWPGNLSPNVHVKVDDEIMLIVDTTLSPTLQVVRGYMGTLAAAHSSLAAAVYGLPVDFQAMKGQTQQNASLVTPYVLQNTQEVTITGSTGSTAATITAAPLAFLNVTGTSGAGLNLPVPQTGMQYIIKNGTTGVCKIYSVGATINGTTGTTAFSLTATGNLTAIAGCSTSGAWQVFGNT